MGEFELKIRLQCVRVPELISSTDLHPCSILCLASVEEQGNKKFKIFIFKVKINTLLAYKVVKRCFLSYV